MENTLKYVSDNHYKLLGSNYIWYKISISTKVNPLKVFSELGRKGPRSCFCNIQLKLLSDDIIFGHSKKHVDRLVIQILT